MYVRKRKAARKKRKTMESGPPEASMPEEYAGDEEGDAEPDRDTPSYAEHQFTFEAFEQVCRDVTIVILNPQLTRYQRFAQEGVVHTLLTYLARFHDFDDPEQLRRVVSLMHRQVVKIQAEGLYYKVSLLPCTDIIV